MCAHVWLGAHVSASRLRALRAALDLRAVGSQAFEVVTGAFNTNIGAWNTASVSNMYMMFYNQDKFNFDIGAWNTASVTTLGQVW
jgi:surface protein